MRTKRRVSAATLARLKAMRRKFKLGEFRPNGRQRAFKARRRERWSGRRSSGNSTFYGGLI